MTTYLVPTNSVDASATVCDYLTNRVDPVDTVHAVNSQLGGDETTAEQIRDGEEALNVVNARLGTISTVETHQFVRGNEPTTDILAYADDVEADELVISLRHRTRTGKLVFGSVAQEILLNANRPVVSVPRELE